MLFQTNQILMSLKLTVNWARLFTNLYTAHVEFSPSPIRPDRHWWYLFYSFARKASTLSTL